MTNYVIVTSISAALADGWVGGWCGICYYGNFFTSTSKFAYVILSHQCT